MPLLKRFRWKTGKTIVVTSVFAAYCLVVSFAHRVGKEGYDAEMDSYYTQWKSTFPFFCNIRFLRQIAKSCCTLPQWWFLSSTDAWSETTSAWSSSTSILTTNTSLSTLSLWRRLELCPRYAVIEIWRSDIYFQVFTVVSPFDSIYRIGFFQRSNLKTFKPLPPPSDYGLDAASMKGLLTSSIWLKQFSFFLFLTVRFCVD